MGMRMILCDDIRLGALCTENLGAGLSRKWQDARTAKFRTLIEHATEERAEYISLFGNIFGQERVAEAVLDGLFAMVKTAAEVQVLLFLNGEEYNRVNYRSDKPENLHLICTETGDMFVDDHVAIRILKGNVELQLDDNDAIIIRRTPQGGYALNVLEEEHMVPSFEPIGFDDSQNKAFGYSVLEWEMEEITDYLETEEQEFTYHCEEVELRPSDDEKKVCTLVDLISQDCGPGSFLRITLSGTAMFGMIINVNALKEQLQKRIFFADIFDNTVMDIDEDSFENDISLSSEFVRLAMQDDSLSETERNKMISFGWNALNGKEVSVE